MKNFSSSWRLLSACIFLIVLAYGSLAQKPELVVQSGHIWGTAKVAFSPDGKLLASGSFDNIIKLWDVSSGTQLRSLVGHIGWVVSVTFSPDGTMLASVGGDNSIRLWDVRSGKERHAFTGRTQSATSVAFSPDGQTLASGECDGTVKLWNVTSGNLLGSLPVQPSQVEAPSPSSPTSMIELRRCVEDVAFSPDGQLLLSGSSDGVIYLWEVSTRALRREFPSLSKPVSAVAFNVDGTTVAGATGSNADDTIRIWDAATGRSSFMVVGLNGVGSIAFSPDGRTLVCGVRDNTIRRWDLSTGASLPSLVGHSSAVNSVRISPDGYMLASGDANATILLWDLRTSSLLRMLPGSFQWIDALAWTPDGKRLVSGSTLTDQAVKVWDLTTGVLTKSWNASGNGVQAAAFDLDGHTLATASGNGIINLWDFSTDSLVRVLAAHPNPNSYTSVSLAFSPDGRTLITGSGSDVSDAVRLWEVATGRQLRSLDGLRNQVASVAYSPSGKSVAIGTMNGPIKLWDISSGEVRALVGHGSWVPSMAFTPDGQTLVSGSFDNTVKVWETSTGKLRRSITNPNRFEALGSIPHQAIDRINAIALDPSGTVVASGGNDGTIRLWDIASGRELRALNGHSSGVKSLAFHPDGRLLASGAEDATIKLWDPRSGNEVASLISSRPNEWMVVTADGLFDESPNAEDKIVWRFNNNTFDYAPVEAFFSEFYYPGLLTEVFAGRGPKAPSDISQKDRRQPQLKLTLADAQSGMLTARHLKIKIDASEMPADKDHRAGSGAQDVRLFRNGSLVKVWHGDVLKGSANVMLEATVPIEAGENRLTAYAFNRDNIKSIDATVTIFGADTLKRKGVAYILAVGLNEYANVQYNLKYAVADALDFSEEVKRQQAKLDNSQRVEVISLNDREATKANILKALADLSTKIQPEDALFIFFAGHGTAQQNHFYLIPHDLGYMGSRTQLNRAKLQRILSHSISDEELERAVEGIDAGQLLLIIDACNSGQALEAEEKRRGPMNSKGLAQLAYEKGMYILTAAQSYQAANEAARLGHGYLTYALIEEGLKTNAADREPKDRQVLLREWLDYATERVPQMQQDELDEQKKQGRQLDRIKFAETDSGTDRSIQRPRVFYRRESEPHPLVVARP